MVRERARNSDAMAGEVAWVFLGFSSQHLCGNSQMAVTLVPGDPLTLLTVQLLGMPVTVIPTRRLYTNLLQEKA